jgi:hypothetical protein
LGELEEFDWVLFQIDFWVGTRCTEIILKVCRALIVEDVDVRFWHAGGVCFETSVGAAILEFSSVLIARADGNYCTRRISHGSGRAWQRDCDILHLANGLAHISTVGGVCVGSPLCLEQHVENLQRHSDQCYQRQYLQGCPCSCS